MVTHRRARKNPSPPPVPPRRPTPKQLSSSLARVRGLAGSVNERERPFSPERPGSWRGSSRDLVVNGRMDEFTRGFLETALWSSTDNSDDSGGDPLDKNYSIGDFTPHALKELSADCEQFQRENADDLAVAYEQGIRGSEGDDEFSAGHDFWLTRCGHGAGFWDGDYPEPQATRLTKSAEKFGNVDLTVEDGVIHADGHWNTGRLKRNGSSRDLVVNPKDSSSYGAGARLRPGYAFEGPDVPNKEIIEIPNDDWETVMISEDDCEDVRFVQYLTIDGARCSVFERKNEPYGYLAQMSHMARNAAVDPRDIPAHLHGAELRDEPEHNGQDVGYSQGMRGKSAEWFQVEYATGSEYSGGSVHESNYRVLAEMLEEHHPEDAQPVVWARTSGGHGTYGIVVRYGDLEEEVREAIDALEDYSLMDEEHHSELEMEQQNEAWEDWGRSDFIKELAKDLAIEDWDELEALITPEQWYAVFEGAREAANEYWEDQQGAGQFINMKRVAKKAGTIVTSRKLPQHSNDYQDDAFEALIAALPEED